MPHTAHCSCGSVELVTRVEPVSVVACHCQACQRRTGSVFGVGAYFAEADVIVTGEIREYIRIADSGNPFHTYFCPTCGTSMFWRSNRNPGLVGVAVGAFADPSFPAPVRSVWEQSMHCWVVPPANAQRFPMGRSS